MGKKKSSKNKKKVTPLMRQYNSMKAKHSDAILLFRVGDFYETFGQDAVEISELLGIVLTSRNNGGSDIELAGFPHHSLNVYLPRLVKAGFRVALCEQLEKPSKNKKIVKRGVTDIVTPGLATDEELLESDRNNFLGSVHYPGKDKVGIAFLDLSTGEFYITEGNLIDLEKFIRSFSPSEVIVSRAHEKNLKEAFGKDIYQYSLDEWIFTLDYGREKLLNHFEVETLKGYGIEELKDGQVAAGAILHYLSSTENHNIQHITSISRIQKEGYLWLDRFTIENLELLESPHRHGKPLLDVIDLTITPMGGRMMKKWIVMPLTDIQNIKNRHDLTEYMVENEDFRDSLKKILKQTADIERLTSKIPLQRINPKELRQLSLSLDLLKPLTKLLEGTENSQFIALSKRLDLSEEVIKRINETIKKEPPVNLNKGPVIKDGANEDLDEYRNIISNSKELLANIQKNEAEKTGITSLKIGFNKVFGYYLEVTNKYKGKGLIPDNWTRKQTLTNSERYITEELKVLEEKILTAEEKSGILEEEIYDELVESLNKYIQVIQVNAQVMSELDCYLSFASSALKYRYNKPEINEGYDIQIKNGRHPVIEQFLDVGEEYIPNDVFLDTEEQQLLMITGPNMSGKSAILRQTALICLLAQMGSYVPAERAEIGVLDKIFTRVGASDNISSGESTFMVEMNETASILNNISDRSLILLDEIGRGTSTYDGISIAWAIAEFLHAHDYRPKTLFATHYHELNELEKKNERIHNYHISIHESKDKIVFLRKLKPGGSEHSFGIHVAKMAGMPDFIIGRAEQILSQMETKLGDHNEKEASQKRRSTLQNLEQPVQLSFFDAQDPKLEEMKKELSEIDIHSLTPIECMLKLKEIQDKVKD